MPELASSIFDRDSAAPVVGGVKAGPRYGRGGFLPVAAIVAALVMTWLKECGRVPTGTAPGCEPIHCRWLRSVSADLLPELAPSIFDRDPAAPVVGGVKAGPRYGRGGFLPVAAIVAAVVMTWLKECGRVPTGTAPGCEPIRCRWLRSVSADLLPELAPSIFDRDPAAPVVGGVKAGPRYGCGGFLPVAAIVAAVVMTWLKECGRCLSEQRRGVIRSAAGGSGRCRRICCRSWLHPSLTEIRPPWSSAG
ncbi:fructose-specific phosphotransferase system IIC component [Desulfoprunum benzoelyticum]|uniref:Fructose-specific phosphotransferase system IIC component n=2 Tax=Desulfoprunum benzoelyticum TaxID=1506996 RepID=A0A840UZV1_9BACT|nr:fructose-specific phosphotransferase system IIC component [Desulfoprunum benzoelyticum]